MRRKRLAPMNSGRRTLYVQIGGRTYFLVTFLDEYSRQIVHHALMPRMDGVTASIEVQAAIERLLQERGGQPPVGGMPLPQGFYAGYHAVPRVPAGTLGPIQKIGRPVNCPACKAGFTADFPTSDSSAAQLHSQACGSVVLIVMLAVWAISSLTKLAASFDSSRLHRPHRRLSRSGLKTQSGQHRVQRLGAAPRILRRASRLSSHYAVVAFPCRPGSRAVRDGRSFGR